MSPWWAPGASPARSQQTSASTSITLRRWKTMSILGGPILRPQTQRRRPQGLGEIDAMADCEGGQRHPIDPAWTPAGRHRERHLRLHLMAKHKCLCFQPVILVPKVGLEPTRAFGPPDFESGASTSSTTSAPSVPDPQYPNGCGPSQGQTPYHGIRSARGGPRISW